MTTRRLVCTSVVATAFALLAGAAGAQPKMALPKLFGTVGKNNAYVIKLLSANGKIVKSLKAGAYTFVIRDDSTMHNYELDGPHGKSWTFTSVPFMGAKTFTINLKAGKYKAYCSPHEAMMFQHFTVT